MEIKIVLDEKLLDNKDYDFFHYKESYKLAECEFGTFYVSSLGELKCSYFDESGEEITRNYDDITRYYVRNNEEYEKAVDEGRLVFDLSNWFEIEFFTKGEDSQYVCLTDEVFGSIWACLETFKNIIKNDEVMEEFENDIKEVL